VTETVGCTRAEDSRRTEHGMRAVWALGTGRVIFVPLFESLRSLGNMLTLCASLRSLPLFTHKIYKTLLVSLLLQSFRFSHTLIQTSLPRSQKLPARGILYTFYTHSKFHIPLQNPTMGCSSSKPIPKPVSNPPTAGPPTPSPTPTKPEGKTQSENLAKRNTPTPPFITAPSTPVPMKGPLASKYGYYDTGFTWISTRDKMME